MKKKILNLITIPLLTLPIISDSCDFDDFINKFKQKEPEKEPEKDLNNNKESEKAKELKIMHWNILNFGGEKHIKGSFKYYTLSKIIYGSNSDIIGLTEVNYNDGDKIKKFVEELNTLDNDDTKNPYSYVLQNVNEARNKEFDSSKELVAIIYKNEKVNFVKDATFNDKINKPVKKGGVTLTFDDNSKQTSFVRPLYGAKFEVYNKENQPKYISTFFGHLDSPGEKKKNDDLKIETGKDFIINNKRTKGAIESQGDQEISEFIGLGKAFEYYQKVFETNNVIFGGDTNIMDRNAILHNSLKDAYDINSYTPDKPKLDYVNWFRTSLVTEPTYEQSKKGYANSYDKFLYKLNDFEISSDPYKEFKIDIVNAFENNLLDKTISTKKYTHDYKKSTNNKDKHPSDFRMIRIGLSDHAPITFTLSIK